MDTDQEFDALAKKGAKMTFNDFELISVLGRGSFGKVMLVKERKTAQFWAMKVIRKDLIYIKQEMKHTYSEAHIIQKLRHPFLTRCMYTFEDNYRICHVLEYRKLWCE